MNRLEEIRGICHSLAKRGWREIFLPHGLDITASDLAGELTRKLTVNRSIGGFVDFCPTGDQGIEPGDPARSLVYHALASPAVQLTGKGAPVPDSAYPTLSELDAVENYIYSCRPFDASKAENLYIGVFAYEYRPAGSNAHGYHADLVFSRTGIARVGTEDPVWYGPWRRYRSDPDGHRGIAVCPARYAAFLAEATNEAGEDRIVEVVGRRDEQNDPIRRFYRPVHKLFAGNDCIKGRTLDLQFMEYHRNEKLRRLHTVGPLKLVPGFDVNSNPLIRDSRNGGELVSLAPVGASINLVPIPRATLVRGAEQLNLNSGRQEPVRFVVPPERSDNRLSSSLQLSPPDAARRYPEYVNIRHQVIADSNGYSVIDMKAYSAKKFHDLLHKGAYEAAHFTDDTCDGCVIVNVRGIVNARRTLPAYSLVAACDFFPLADQLEIANWVRRSFINYQEHFAQGAPWPLCEGRRPVNIELPRPDMLGERAFDRKDETVTAIVGLHPRSRVRCDPDREKRVPGYLTDGASNEFEPGWDVSLGGDEHGNYLAAYGLGSPFPEDAKLCAALNSFWPAAAPDASRTFAIYYAPTAIPMLDAELGYHKDHPRVKEGKVTESRGWDGEQGPFLELKDGHHYVNAANYDRSDYVSNALAGRIDIRKTSGITGDELIRRMDALRRCIETLPPADDWVSNTKLWLVTAEAVADWALESKRSSAAQEGSGYFYVFVTFNRHAKPTRDLTRLRYEVKHLFECQTSAKHIGFREDGGDWREMALPSHDTRHDDQSLMMTRP